MRIIIYADNPCNFEFELGDFPYKPSEGDLIMADDFSDNYVSSDLSDEQLKSLANVSSFEVSVVVWKRDERGIYLRLICTVETK